MTAAPMDQHGSVAVRGVFIMVFRDAACAADRPVQNRLAALAVWLPVSQRFVSQFCFVVQ